MSTFVAELNSSMSPALQNNVFSSIWDEYERVIVQSLVTSFGLDFLIHDQHGGDVDTIHNVRKIGSDPNIKYKNKQNEKDYENRNPYDRVAYHSDNRYKNIVKNAKKDFNQKGLWTDDAYITGNTVAPVSNKTIPRNRQGQLDHVVSASEIHNDAGRILSGLDGIDLANSPENLRYTNATLNNNMRDKSMEEYIKWCEDNPDKVNWNGKKGEPLSEDVKNKLRAEYNRAKKEYDTKLVKNYYTSSKFIKDTTLAAAHCGGRMAARQALGFVFIEIWYSAKKELQSMPPHSDLKDMLDAVQNGVQNGVNNARLKYREIISKLEEGFAAGILSSLTTTLCNIFFTTAKNLVKTIRQIYASVIQAGKVLLFNPDNLMFGDRIKTSSVILATGASVLVGASIGELIGLTPIGKIPVIGELVQTFSSTLVSGLLSCTLLVFLDRSKFMNQVINGLNKIPSEANNYKQIADALERIAAKLANLDIAKFKKYTEKYQDIALRLDRAKSETEVNRILLCAYETLGIKIPWEGDFDTFMGNRSNKLVFE